MKKSIYLTLFAMLAYLNLNARVTLGNVRLENVSQFEISESITEMSTTAKITIPKNYALKQDVAILQQFKVGDKVTIKAGYDGDYQNEFIGYISEIDSDIPLIISCEDMYKLRQNNIVKSYPAGTKLKTVLHDIVPNDEKITIECDDVTIGKYSIDNASTFAVLQDLSSNFGLYSRLQNGVLKVGLAYDYGANTRTHEYVIGKNVKQNQLKYKRAEDVKIRFKAVATNPNGKKTTVIVGAKEKDASERTLNFAGPMSEEELKKQASAALAKVRFDGYQGCITGFGMPHTRAGDALLVKDEFEKDNEYREGSYLIESVTISYGNGGFSRENKLSYKI